MLIGISDRTRAMSAKLSCSEKKAIENYMLGAINDFCKNCKGQELSVRKLFGEENRDWNGTPMQEIYDYHISNGKTEKAAKRSSAIDAGNFLKKILKNDKVRKFEFTRKTSGNNYKLVK